MQERCYIAIDLKSFYASVECIERGLDPLTTNLVVADVSRTEKTICLAVSPSLKAYGIPGRARLFEVVQKVREVNASKKKGEPELTYIAAQPRMALYMKYSTDIYQIYMKYVAPEDIHVYSIDEVFMDVTAYLHTYRMTPRELAGKMIRDVLAQTGITATAGIGTNLYLCKVAMDIVAKHVAADADGVRIAELDEMSYRRLLWNHRPLTDFWRVGHGYAKRLAEVGITTMGEIARCSLGRETEFYNEDLLYRIFGVNAELLIDHAWGWEPVTIAEIKAYKPENNSLSSGQVLQSPYPFEKAGIIVREMTEALALDMASKGLVADGIVLYIGYDVENLSDEGRRKAYHGEVTVDRYGRMVPKHAHGTEGLGRFTSSAQLMTRAAMAVFEKVVDPALLVRRINVTAVHVMDEGKTKEEVSFEQMDLFRDYGLGAGGAGKGNGSGAGAAGKGFGAFDGAGDSGTLGKGPRTAGKGIGLFGGAGGANGDGDEDPEAMEKLLEREKKMQQAVLSLQKRFGKNAVLKGTDLVEGATAQERNRQIGGHKA